MIRMKWAWIGLFALCSLVASSGRSYAQSSIVGVVKDTSGGVLPGVTVEASSDVLIEKLRSVITDVQGQFRLVDLRPGVYQIVFTLPGFASMRHEKFELPADFTATINAELKVGSLEETITVSGQSPVVDTQTASRPQVLNRMELDSLPSGRTVQAVGALVVGINLSVPDTGGTTALQQTYMSVHGATSGNVTVLVDGINMTGMQGSVQAYWNEAMNQEIAYQTSGMNAEVAGGGVRINMIPRDGGNRFNGSAFGNFSNAALQGSNLSDDLKAAGLTSVDKIDRVWDSNISQGGRIIRDKLWFFGSYRNFGVWAPVAETFYADGTQGISDEDQQNYLARLTWQISPKHKFAAYYDRIYRFRGHSMGAGDDPATAAIRWTTPTTYDSMAKLTSTLTNKLMFELGFSAISTEFKTGHVNDSLDKERGTPEWYATTRKQDLERSTIWNAGTEGMIAPFRNHINGALSYVTGNHNLKGGVQQSWGVFHRAGDLNGDLIQRYNSGVPVNVVVNNTPRGPRDELDLDLGLYVQDSWRLNRLTLNPGLRYEMLKNSMPTQWSPQGRFKPASIIEGKPGADWKNWSPRIGAVYDLRGDGRTALKFSAARYNTSERTDFIDSYNPAIAASTATLSWQDLDQDDIADGELGCVYLQPGCEINIAGQLPRGFGTPALSINPTEDLRTNGRGYNYEFSGGAEQQIRANLSVAAMYFHRNLYGYTTTDYLDRTNADYTAVPVVSPLNGEVFNVYNLAASKVALTNRVDSIANNDLRYNTYRGFEISFRYRLPGGGSVFGGTSTGRTLTVMCDQPDNPNMLRFCDQTVEGVTPPIQTSYKVSASYPLPKNIRFGISYVRQPGGALSTNWLITRNVTRYAADCLAPCTPGALVIPGMTEATLTVPLKPTGVDRLGDINNLDMRFGRVFNVGKMSLEGLAEVYNVLNSSTALAVRSSNYGTATFWVPGGSGDVGTRGAIPYARFIKFGVNVRW